MMKQTYITPAVQTRRVFLEESVAATLSVRGVIQNGGIRKYAWEIDATPPAADDGEIWLEF